MFSLKEKSQPRSLQVGRFCLGQARGLLDRDNGTLLET